MSLNRREFLKGAAGIAAGTALSGAGLPNIVRGSDFNPPVQVVKGANPAENTRKAIEMMGGMEKFVKSGQKVFIKPNCITTSKPESAINTNPEVVAEVVRLCMKAGASEVLYMGHDQASSWEGNGIGDAISAHGGKLVAANEENMYKPVKLPRGLILRETSMIKELMEYDVFINIPVAKHHAGAQLTLSMKNYMGLNWDRVIMHRTDLDQTIADLATSRPADLIIMDATRMLLTNGPSGPGAVKKTDTIIASTDPVAVDAYTASMFKLDPRRIRQIQAAYDLGLGEFDERKMDINEISLG